MRSTTAATTRSAWGPGPPRHDLAERNGRTADQFVVVVRFLGQVPASRQVSPRRLRRHSDVCGKHVPLGGRALADIPVLLPREKPDPPPQKSRLGFVRSIQRERPGGLRRPDPSGPMHNWLPSGAGESADKSARPRSAIIGEPETLRSLPWPTGRDFNLGFARSCHQTDCRDINPIHTGRFILPMFSTRLFRPNGPTASIGPAKPS